ncbi:signal peptidase I [Catenisphaera adipataccumulans]|jgi:signal peptidase I|uniref:Signal peptidase I n=1 Tax=Catenisphaera adipataccumulans TaxID=700500 RepID=A0A7W8CXD4_9FIRM|nr:signal peptidase I [Catenisphaera adipataccumulans]MBB5183375.1 signal peptidase I [Catenisphaera adipataccumulans]
MNDMKSTPGPPSLKQAWKAFGLKCLFTALFLVLLTSVFFGVQQADDGHMAPAVKAGDLIFFDRLDHSYVSGDLVMVNQKQGMEARRVVAAAGDTVDLTEEGLVINGYLQQEDEIYTETLPFQDGIRFPIKVPKGKIFVLADDRTHASDSRLYGCVSLRSVQGKVITIIRRRNF